MSATRADAIEDLVEAYRDSLWDLDLPDLLHHYRCNVDGEAACIVDEEDDAAGSEAP